MVYIKGVIFNLFEKKNHDLNCIKKCPIILLYYFLQIVS